MKCNCQDHRDCVMVLSIALEFARLYDVRAHTVLLTDLTAT